MELDRIQTERQIDLAGMSETGLDVPIPTQYSCAWCGQVFNKQMGWKYHVDNNTCNRAPCCVWCRQVFDSSAAQTHHVDNNVCGKSPFCGYCRKIFKSHEDAGSHIENNLCGLIPQDNESDFIQVNASANAGVVSMIDNTSARDETLTLPQSILPANQAQNTSLHSQHNNGTEERIVPSETFQLSAQNEISAAQKQVADEVNQGDHDDIDDICMKCCSGADEDKLLLCDGCDNGCHIYCCDPPLAAAPIGDWFCAVCDSVPCGKCNTSRRNNNYIRCYSCKSPYHMDCVQASEASRDEANWCCPKCNLFCKYCNKSFKSADGLKYHVKNNVCRSSANPAENRVERAISHRVAVEKKLAAELDTSEQNDDEANRVHSNNCENTVLDRRLFEIPSDQNNEIETQLLNDPLTHGDGNDEAVVAADDDVKCSCNKCGVDDDQNNLQFCDGCNNGYHLNCVEPPLERHVEDDWYCKVCSTAPCVACGLNHASDNNPVRCFLCQLPFHFGCIKTSEYCKTWSCGKCKRLVCKHCNKSFKSADGLKYHKEKNVCRILVSKEVVANCPSCSKSFTTQAGYTYHMQNVCVPSRKKARSSSSQKGGKPSRASSDNGAAVTSDGKRRRVPTDRFAHTARELCDSDDDASVSSHESSVINEMVVKKRKTKRIVEEEEEDGLSDGSSDSEEKHYVTKKSSHRPASKIDVNAFNWDATYRAAKVKWNQHNIDGHSNRSEKCCLSAAMQASLQERVGALELSSLSEWLGCRYNDTKTVREIMVSLNCNMEVRDMQGPNISLSPLSAHDRNQTTIDKSTEPALEGVITVVPTISTSSESNNPFYCEVCDMSFLGASAFISHEKSKIHNQLKTGSITLDYGEIASRGPNKQRIDKVQLRTDFVVNTCIPITSVAICPDTSPDGVAYAAIGGSHFRTEAESAKINIDQEFVLGKTYNDPSLLQIWKIGKECKLLYFIGLRNSGPVWQCKWLSLEKVPAEVIGILSVVCGDGTCLVLVIPKFDTNLSGNDVVIDESHLVLWKICLSSVVFTATCWDTVRINETESSLEIMCGSLDGVIYHWNLGLMATDLRTTCVVDTCTNNFQNIRNNAAHPIDSAISAMSVCPIDRALFLAASYSGSVCVWNKEQRHKPVFSKNYVGSIGWINDAKWDPNGMGVYLTGSDLSNILFQRFVPDIGGFADVIMFHESYYACSNSIQACAYDGHTVLLSAATDGTIRFCFPSVSTLLSQNSSKLFASGQLFHIIDCEKDASASRPGSKGQSKVSCDYYSKCSMSNSMVKNVVEKKVGFTSLDMITCKQTPLCVYGSKSGLLRIHTFEESICNKIFGAASTKHQ